MTSTGKRSPQRASAPGAYGEGDEGRQVGQGESPATPLTHSYSGKALAVCDRVTENDGAATPGVDEVIWNTPQKKAQAVATLKTTRVSPSTASTCLHSKAKRQETPPGHPLHAVPGDASTLLASPETHMQKRRLIGNPTGFRREQ